MTPERTERPTGIVIDPRSRRTRRKRIQFLPPKLETLPPSLSIKMLKKINKEETQTFINLLELVQAVASKYEGDNLETVGMAGLKKGLESYLKNERWNENYKIGIYLSWWIKTAIEAHLEIDNEDTRAWFNKTNK